MITFALLQQFGWGRFSDIGTFHIRNPRKQAFAEISLADQWGTDTNSPRNVIFWLYGINGIFQGDIHRMFEAGEAEYDLHIAVVQMDRHKEGIKALRLVPLALNIAIPEHARPAMTSARSALILAASWLCLASSSQETSLGGVGDGAGLDGRQQVFGGLLHAVQLLGQNCDVGLGLLPLAVGRLSRSHGG